LNDIANVHSTNLSDKQINTIRNVGLKLRGVALQEYHRDGNHYRNKIEEKLLDIVPILGKLPAIQVLTLMWIGKIPSVMENWQEHEEDLLELAEELIKDSLPGKHLKVEVSEWHCCETCDREAAQDSDNEGGDDEEDDDDEGDEKEDDYDEEDDIYAGLSEGESEDDDNVIQDGRLWRRLCVGTGLASVVAR
jgi:hypothetical protein